MKDKVTSLFFFLVLLAGHCAATMTPSYAVYTNAAYNPSNQTVTLTATLQGSTTCSPGLCPGLNAYFYHSPHLTVGNVQGDFHNNGEVFCPGCYINGSASYVVSGSCLTTGGCQVTTSASVYCSILASNIFSTIMNMQIEVAYTVSKMRPIQVPPGGTCVTLGFVLECQYDTITWCTPGTTPPDYNPPGVTNVAEATYPTYWAEWAACERLGPGLTWSCFGVTPNGYSFPDNYPLQVCTKHP
jgi:hypothetical protein